MNYCCEQTTSILKKTSAIERLEPAKRTFMWSISQAQSNASMNINIFFFNTVTLVWLTNH